MVQVKFTRAATKIYSYWNREVIYSQHLTSEKDPPQIIINTYIQCLYTILLSFSRSVQIENSLKSPLWCRSTHTTLQTIHCIATSFIYIVYMYCRHIHSMRNKTRTSINESKSQRGARKWNRKSMISSGQKKICFTI